MSAPGLAVLAAHMLVFASAAQDDLPRGRLIDRVACRSDSNQSYALYLPSGYDSARTWPILYCFDPGARGGVPVELFREAAEQYGYIVAGSNNSRNGPEGRNAESMNAMGNDTQERFAIDRARVFAAGMSGGARVACGFAQSGSSFAGVIAFAAGFPGAQVPDKIRFLFFGAAGVDDFNYPELRRLDGDLDRLGAARRIVTFDGGHGWPPAAVCIQAVEWLELQSMKAGIRAQDPAMIDRLFEKAAGAIRAAELARRPGEVYLLTKAAAEDFRGLKDITDWTGKASRLENSKDVRKYLEEEKEQEVSQNRSQAELLAYWNQRYYGEDTAGAVPRFAALLQELKRQSEASRDTGARRVARRTLQGSYIYAIEQSRAIAERKDYAAAAQMLEFAVAIHPDRPQVLYSLASVYAKAKDRRGALNALKRAVSSGFRDSAALERDAAFDFLRSDTAYEKLLRQMKP